MIKDKIGNIGLYEKLNANMSSAIRCLREEHFMDDLVRQGRIDGNGFYAMLQEYITRPEDSGRWEAHKKYIDIQYVLSGEERTGYANIESLGKLQEANREKDFYFYESAESIDWLTVRAGEFVIFFPADGHMPSLNVSGEGKTVKKVVFKVEV